MSFRSNPNPGRAGVGWQALLASLTLDRWLLAAALLLACAAGALMGVQSDTWWQLRTGQLILASGQIPTTDPFSSTVRGGPWPNHEWLAQVLFALAYAAGGLPALWLAGAALVALMWYGLALLCEGPGRVRASALLLGLAGHSVIWSVRPHLFSLALAVAALLLVPRRRWHWLYPPLLALWANLHAGVAFGGAIVVVAWLVACAHELAAFMTGSNPQATNGEGRATKPQQRAFSSLVFGRSSLALHWGLVALLSGLATLLNPLGVGLWRYVLSSFGDTTRTYLSEWQPPSLSWPASYPFFILVGLTALAVVWARKTWRGQRDWTLLALALLFGWLGFRSIRHTAFFTLAAVPLLTRPLRDWAPLPPAPRQGLLNLLLLAGLALGSAALVASQWAGMPRESLSPAIVAGVRACQGTLYNTYDTGGPLIWAVPERLVFVDNRQDPYPADLLFHAVIAEQRGDYRALFEQYGVRCALAPAGQALDRALRRDGWRELASDGRLVVLEK